MTIEAACVDAKGVVFRSSAELIAGTDGVVDPATQPSVAGTYEGGDPHGLSWSMAANPASPFEDSLDPIETTLTARCGGMPLATAIVVRRWLREDLSPLPVRERGLVGTLFAPPERRSPAVIVMGGSGGGLHWSEPTAALLASRGFTALALAYFGLPGLPPGMADVPLEYVGTAIDWLRRHDRTAGSAVALMGASRGAELALLAASHLPEVGAVVAYAPSAVAWGQGDPRTGEMRSTWTWRGRQVPSIAVGLHATLAGLPASPTMCDLFSSALDNTEAAERAAIEVERFRGPVLLVSGGDDAIWPSERFATMVLDRLERRPREGPSPHRHLHTPGAGHSAGRVFGLPASEGASYHPVLDRVIASGGTKEANAASCAAAWPAVLAFLRSHLPGSPPRPASRTG